ncbi:hypothetical protein [Croceibacterium ferulae]|uniref:hypothetical protein n=1 Tax=Croceibacterium ferulae TaxID=1854641 RepID=UPI000EB09163|nr:hypothetical protein [Croceibacterium ferulae]
MRWMLPFAALLGWIGPAAAQDGTDRARLDDFAIPRTGQEDGSLRIEQLEPDAAPLPPPTPAPMRDSTAPAGASTAADSAPRATPAISGTDRCDPQQPSADQAECRAILETRARDFAATAPAALSAEQALIASQPAPAMRQDSVTANRRVRAAGTGLADDELRSNQELATIYLARQRQQGEPPPEPEPTEIPEALGEVIQALQQAGDGTGR